MRDYLGLGTRTLPRIIGQRHLSCANQLLLAVRRAYPELSTDAGWPFASLPPGWQGAMCRLDRASACYRREPRTSASDRLGDHPTTFTPTVWRTGTLGHNRKVVITLDQIRQRREAIRGVLEARGAVNPRVFGSVAHGKADEKSDVDILIDFRQRAAGLRFLRGTRSAGARAEPAARYPSARHGHRFFLVERQEDTE